MSFAPEKKQVILGAGGHARVLQEALRLRGGVVSAFVADSEVASETALQARQHGIRIVPTDLFEREFSPKDTQLYLGIGAIDRLGLQRRAELFKSYREKGYEFPALVHPKALVAEGVGVGSGSQILMGSIVQIGVRIGDNAIINTGAQLDHDCQIGAHSHIAPAATLAGSVVVSELCLVGAGAVVIQGLRISEQTLVGAGAVVLDDLPGFSTAAGVPAKIVG